MLVCLSSYASSIIPYFALDYIYNDFNDYSIYSSYIYSYLNSYIHAYVGNINFFSYACI